MIEIFEDRPHLITQNKFNLKPWMEIKGKSYGISKDDLCIYVSIDDKVLVFKKESNEASYIQDNLNDGLIGKYLYSKN